MISLGTRRCKYHLGSVKLGWSQTDTSYSDGRAYLSDSDLSSCASEDDRTTARTKSRAPSAAQLDFFAGDPWNAMVVLGLRVYSKGEVKIKVVRDEDEDDE